MSVTRRFGCIAILLGVAGAGCVAPALGRPTTDAFAWLPELLPDTIIEPLPTPTIVNGIALEIVAAHSSLPSTAWEQHLREQWSGFGADYAVHQLGASVVVARRRAPWQDTAVVRSLPTGATRIVFSRLDLSNSALAAGCELSLPRGIQLRSAVRSPQLAAGRTLTTEQCWLESPASPSRVMSWLAAIWRREGWQQSTQHVDAAASRIRANWHRRGIERVVSAQRVAGATDIIVLQQVTP
ncbi:MAG TPA: hypothetical protein P5528_09045 [Steroidobacteraceae bacterium]|nr:hypothetical protein [Steroidobacteraceae bacterium]HRX89578.1 hypothetical protein [Steroidobacteraceae bacterium]